MAFSVRDYTPEDKNYIYKSWLKGMHLTPQFKGCRDRFYFPVGQKIVNMVLDSKKTKIKIITLDDDDKFIVGFYVVWKLEQSTIIWWIHIRDVYRQQGICTKILDGIKDKNVAYVFTKPQSKIDVATKLFKPRNYEYWPTLLFELQELV